MALTIREANAAQLLIDLIARIRLVDDGLLEDKPEDLVAAVGLLAEKSHAVLGAGYYRDEAEHHARAALARQP